MGNTQSLPSVDHRASKSLYGKRKLSKPRVGNHGGGRDISCLSLASAIIGGRVSKTKNGAVHGITSAAPRQQAIQERTILPNPENETATLKSWGPHRQHHSLSYSRNRSASYIRNQSLDLTGSYRDTSLPLSRYNSSRHSTLTSQNVRAEPEGTYLEQSHPLPSVMRRRSQIYAAPPATKTRRQPTSTLKGSIPGPQLLALDLAERDRAQTPLGYSVLGGFKRGSLRIVNTTPSPALSTQDARPRRRNTSPVHTNTSTHSLQRVTLTPQLLVTPGDHEGYFGYHGKLTVPNSALNGPPTVGEIHQSESLTPLSFQTAEEVSQHVEASEIHIHILPPIVGHLKKAQSTTAQGKIISSSELPQADQQLNPSSNYASPQPWAHERCSLPAADRTEGSPDQAPIVRSVSSSSSNYSDPLEHRVTEARHTQKSSARRLSVKTGTDSGYGSTGSIKSWTSGSRKIGDGEFHTACTTPSAELNRGIPDSNHSEPAMKGIQTDTEKQLLQATGRDEPPLKTTDKYRIRATQEGPIFEDIVLSGRARRPSHQLREHFLAHKRNFTRRLRSDISSRNLAATMYRPVCSSIDKQQINIPGPFSNKPEPSIVESRKLGAENISSSDWAVVGHSQTQISPSSQKKVEYITDAKQHLHNPQLHYSQSFSQSSRRLPSYTGADYYRRFSIRRESMEIAFCTAVNDTINSSPIVPISASLCSIPGQ